MMSTLYIAESCQTPVGERSIQDNGTTAKDDSRSGGSHPADAFDMAGGAMALHRRAGDRVVVLSITPGARSHAPLVYGGDVQVELTREAEAKLFAETSIVKKSEFQAACDVIGAEMICLDHEDEPLLASEEVILELAEHYRVIRPDVLITHHETEVGNHDHPPAGIMAVRAVTSAARWLKGSSLAPYQIPAVYFFNNQFRPMAVRLHAAIPVPPAVVLDVESVIEEKARMLQAFKTQAYAGMGYDSKEYADFRFKAVEGAVGLEHGLSYAEAFSSLKPAITDLLYSSFLQTTNQEDKHMLTRESFKGLCVLIITPMDDLMRVDFDGHTETIRKLVDLGVDGVILNGANGEFHTSTQEEKNRLLETLVEEGKGQAHVCGRL